MHLFKVPYVCYRKILIFTFFKLKLRLIKVKSYSCILEINLTAKY